MAQRCQQNKIKSFTLTADFLTNGAGADGEHFAEDFLGSSTYNSNYERSTHMSCEKTNTILTFYHCYLSHLRPIYL